MFRLSIQKEIDSKNPPKKPKKPKKPKNPENPKIKIFQNMSCGVSLESYGPGEQF